MGRRLWVAFMVVTVASVALLALAVVVGVDRAETISRTSERKQAVEQLAAIAATGYSSSGWSAADLQAVRAFAQSVGAGVELTGSQGEVVLTTLPEKPAARPGRNAVSAAVQAEGQQVGVVELHFGPGTVTSSDESRLVAWIGVSALVAVLLATVVAWIVARQFTEPMRRLTAAGTDFARGDRSVRAETNAPGEIGDLARTFNAAVVAVSESEQAQRNLIADVAHELRTPLAALHAGLEEMRDGYVPADAEALGRLHDQTMRLGRTVSDLQSLAAAETPTIHQNVVQVDLSEVAREETLERRPLLNAAGLTVSMDLRPVIIEADPDRLHEVVGNLLSNASKYCRSGDEVTVRVARDDKRAILEVSDTGPGIPVDELPHVFERFWRGTSDRRQGGSGLGLAIVRAIVTAQGGEVSVDSTPGQGATFRVAWNLA